MLEEKNLGTGSQPVLEVKLPTKPRREPLGINQHLTEFSDSIKALPSAIANASGLKIKGTSKKQLIEVFQVVSSGLVSERANEIKRNPVILNVVMRACHALSLDLQESEKKFPDLERKLKQAVVLGRQIQESLAPLKPQVQEMQFIIAGNSQDVEELSRRLRSEILQILGDAQNHASEEHGWHVVRGPNGEALRFNSPGNHHDRETIRPPKDPVSLEELKRLADELSERLSYLNNFPLGNFSFPE